VLRGFNVLRFVCLFTYSLIVYFHKNRPVPLPGQRSYEATKPWCSPDWQCWGQQSQNDCEIVCPVKQWWLRCRQLHRWKNLRWVLKIDVVILRLFCELDKTMERLVFESKKNKNNAFESYQIAFTLSWKTDKFTCRMPTCLFLFTSVNDVMSIFRTLLFVLFSVVRVIADFAATNRKVAGSLNVPLALVLCVFILCYNVCFVADACLLLLWSIWPGLVTGWG